MELDDLLNRLRQGDDRALARALTLVESQGPDARDIVSRIFAESGSAIVVGLTGPPGVGKSTLADALAREARKAGRKVAILAIDPTSPVTGGALLGDRARMASDSSTFIRSMATRGHVGGLAGAAFESLILLEASGKDLILLETVGSGQDEVEVAAAADVTLLVLAPGLGDEVQAAKSGILEVADILVANKSDREGADLLVQELNGIAGDRAVVTTIATQGGGVANLLSDVLRLGGKRAPDRDRRLMEVWLWNVLQKMLRDRIPPAAWDEAVEGLVARKRTPYEVARELLKGASRLMKNHVQPARAETARPGGSGRAEGADPRESGRPPRAKSDGSEPSEERGEN
ncbi:MAG: methylmalonyl Co-A mutase-associated GTPase MeaB [Vicinamibacteria bacterium]